MNAGRVPNGYPTMRYKMESPELDPVREKPRNRVTDKPWEPRP